MIIEIVKRPQMTSNDLEIPEKNKLVKPDSAINRTIKNKSKMRGGSMLEIGEIYDEYLDEILHKYNL